MKVDDLFNFIVKTPGFGVLGGTACAQHAEMSRRLFLCTLALCGLCVADVYKRALVPGGNLGEELTAA